MSLAYRPEIDGLRAIAVLLVIFNHLGWSVFSGGFVGVDVFFVISGYLITGIVYKEAQAGKFSFLDFYKRRVLRLAPAYFIVLIAVTIVSFAILLPAELLNYFKSVSYATVFLANFYMWKEVGGYFGANADVIPLLHLWSLAVEEQFYIFWPVTLLLLIKCFRKPFILPLILCGFILSVAISEYGVKHYLAAAYFLMPTRIFELLIGGVLVFLPKSTSSFTNGKILSLIGLGLIFYSAVSYKKDMYFPGIAAVLPCMGAALILVFGGSQKNLVGKVLSVPLMIRMGKLSYPAYLWHWPIIAFINLYAIAINWKLSILIIVVTIFLSQITYSYLEKPAHKLKRYGGMRVIGWGFFVPAIALIGLSACAKYEKGWPSRFSESLNIKSESLLSLPSHARGRCNEGNIQNPLSADQCILGVGSRPVDFLLVGDSHANAEAGMLDVIARNAGLRGYDITQSNTIFLPDVKRFYKFNGGNVEQAGFILRNNVLVKKIQEGHYKAVIMGGSFAEHYNSGDFVALGENISSQDVFESKLEAAIDIIQAAGSTAVIVRDTPDLGQTKFDCTLTNERFNRSDNCSINRNDYLSYFKGWDAVLARLTKKYPKLIIIDPAKVTCNQETCFSQIDGVPLYHDEGHLSQIGSELIGKKYISEYGNPLLTIGNTRK